MSSVPDAGRIVVPMGTQVVVRADEALAELFGGGGGHPDPYPLYRALREQAPVHRSEHDGVWYLSRHADCMKVLLGAGSGRKPAGVHSARPFFIGRAQAQRITRRARQTMLWSNPPDHGRLRRLVSRVFTAPRVEDLRPRITHLVDGCLDTMIGARDTDVMDTLALRLPIQVIGDLVGVPEADRDRLRKLFYDTFSGETDEAHWQAVDRAAQAEAAIDAYFSDLVAERRAAPRSDLLSALIAARDGEDRLSEAELLTTASLIFGAGFVTTTNLIGNGLLALLRHPGEMARLWSDPGLAPSAVEEILRFDSPVRLVGRYLFEPIDLGHRVIDAGEFVLVLTAAANRDPGRFADPETFDVGRADNQPLSFGWGIHHCLGAQLARLEGQAVFRRLAERTASIQLLDEHPPWGQGVFLRGLQSLPVRLRARP
ncbi:MAG: cytochrome P450 [Acidimicrobiia bacterium]